MGEVLRRLALRLVEPMLDVPYAVRDRGKALWWRLYDRSSVAVDRLLDVPSAVRAFRARSTAHVGGVFVRARSKVADLPWALAERRASAADRIAIVADGFRWAAVNGAAWLRVRAVRASAAAGAAFVSALALIFAFAAGPTALEAGTVPDLVHDAPIIRVSAPEAATTAKPRARPAVSTSRRSLGVALAPRETPKAKSRVPFAASPRSNRKPAPAATSRPRVAARAVQPAKPTPARPRQKSARDRKQAKPVDAAPGTTGPSRKSPPPTVVQPSAPPTSDENGDEDEDEDEDRPGKGKGKHHDDGHDESDRDRHDDDDDDRDEDDD